MLCVFSYPEYHKSFSTPIGPISKFFLFQQIPLTTYVAQVATNKLNVDRGPHHQGHQHHPRRTGEPAQLYSTGSGQGRVIALSIWVD